MREPYTATELGGIANLALMARVKPGFVDAFETFTCAKRLELLFKLLNASRLATRESARLASPFQDSVGRWGIIQSFRYAVFTPDDPAAGPLDLPGVHRVYLNVAFDGGWEPYLRVIYRDLGALLDAIFCNCDGYPLARESSFEAYERWVRNHEVVAGINYNESSMSVGDQRYLSQLERIQREERDPLVADRRIAGLALPDAVGARKASFARALRNPAHALDLAFRGLRAFHALRPLYPREPVDDDRILRRFARDALIDFLGLVHEGLFVDLLARLVGPSAQAMANALQRQHADELQWLLADAPAPRPAPEPPFDPGAVQAGILDGFPHASHGALVGLQVVDAAAAVQWLADERWASAATSEPAARLWRNVALSWQGLRRLGVPASHLQKFPQEFADGMESRAGLLGDLRGNHPDHWRRPRLNWPPGCALDGAGVVDALAPPTVELTSVHVVVQLRIDDAAEPGHTLHPQLADEIHRLETAGSGLKVLFVQPTRSWRDPANPAIQREHFGFRDGISQPRIAGAPAAPPNEPRYWSGNTRRGEVLLGRASDRDPAPPTLLDDELLLDGSFLVVRKLRQHVGRLHQVLDAQVAGLEPFVARRPALKRQLLDQLMGRGIDGQPLADPGPGGANDFNYAADPNGQRCPFHSHVRRANPRTAPETALPKIVRRGMSYGPRFDANDPAAADGERGLVFMAYAASLAEQFEVLQRWLAGGNSSGTYSAPGDPFLGVPASGEPRVFRWLQPDGTVLRVDLGDQPLVELQWGQYLFVPSLRALAALPRLVRSGGDDAAPGAALPSPGPAPSADFVRWQALLEDESRREAAWAQVRTQPGGRLQTDYGLLLGSADAVAAAFQDDGRELSVCGYGERFHQTIGEGYLGQDTALDPQAGALADAVNALIEGLDAADVYEATRTHATAWLQQRRVQQVPVSGEDGGLPLDLMALSIAVLAALNEDWFGLPGLTPDAMQAGDRLDGVSPPKVTCPGHLLTVSRHVFSPHPSNTVAAQAAGQGAAFRQALAHWWADPSRVRGPLTTAIVDAVHGLPHTPPGPATDDLIVRTLAGVMLGFAPTVHGNFRAVMAGWIDSRQLWDLQIAWHQARAGGDAADFALAARVLQAPLIARMRESPVPYMLWRTEVAPKRSLRKRPAGGRVILGIGSALREPHADPGLLFGGRRHGPQKAQHACPGSGIAMGVLLGLLTTLLEAGAMRPTASSTQLTLT